MALTLLIALLAAYELAAARVPQHRAALEELIRYQTGLEVRFGGLRVRWGWYGPEALFEDVELGESPGRGMLLRAPRLIVSLDAWRMVRSGHLEARRITLEDPSIDLAGESQAGQGAARRSSLEARGDAGASILARWRGGQINISGGTLRTVLPGGTDAVTLGISHAELQRLDANWSAEAQVLLPRTLGASMHVTLRMRARADLQDISSAAVSVEGHHLELAAWAALAAGGARSELPRSGNGDLQIQAAFVHGRLHAASGRIAAESLGWRAPGDSDTGFALERVRGKWQLMRRGTSWRLRIDALELEPLAGSPLGSISASGTVASVAAAVPASVVVDFTPDGSEARGRAQHAPLAPLLSLVRWYVPQLPRHGLMVRGEARELSFDWNSHRAPGARLAAWADLQALALADDSGAIELTGLTARASAAQSSVVLALHAGAARLVPREAPAPLENLEIDAQLKATASAHGTWQLEAQDLRIRRHGLSLSASGAISIPAPGAPPLIDARLSMKEADAGLLGTLLASCTTVACGEVAAALGSGRVESGELNWRGPLIGLPWSAPGARFSGSLVVRDATLRESANWPAVADLSARIDWRGAQFRALIERARLARFALTDARADWDGRAGGVARFRGRLAGDAEQMLAWLQSHPQAAAWAPGLEHLDLRGNTLLDLDFALPVASVSDALPPAPRLRIAAQLDGAQLRPLPGLPPLEALRGTLAFAGGQLQRSTLTARWLGGAASLTVAERREQGLNVLVVSGRGVMDAHAAVEAASANVAEAGLSGSADWSALLTLVPGGAAPHWQLHADSSLAGIASALPEPFAKPAGPALPLHVDLNAQSEGAQLRIALGERLAAVAALVRSGDSWRIDRGAVRLGGATPALPVEPVLVLDGSVSRLDLAACLALLRQAARDAALPRLEGHLSATELTAGERRFSEVGLAADIAGGAGALRIESSELSSSARWPAAIDASQPAVLHLTRFNIVQPGDASIVAQLAAALAPAVRLAVDDLQWQGRSLGTFSGTLALHGEEVEASDLILSAANAEARASARCLQAGCNLAFSFDSGDPAATLAALGLAPELTARHAHLEGQLRFPASASLATLGGSLHMRLEDGAMGPAADGAGAPSALLSVPALLGGLSPVSSQASPALRFAQFSADYELLDGQAVTSDLHFDGDAEILVRGRVGLARGDYDERAWILRGEDRLPAALRRLGPGPGVAAVWLSLRDLLGSDGSEHSHAALHLQGPWTHPVVALVE
ncbi:MAG TPA: DUF3971 domain-containing protein [Steroidobacteraceae bacterium]|nr:DUF3971 domain-containing protein [Steroidobacteraceae bacterium]